MLSYRNPIVQEDLKALADATLDWQALKNKTILVTGATGMLATYFSYVLMFLNEHCRLGVRIILLARNKNKLEAYFGEETEFLRFLIQDVCDEISFKAEIDYIFHAAGSASPYYITHDPTGIISANTLGTLNILKLALTTGLPKIIFTSTREIYGKVDHTNRIAESDMGTLDPLDSRACYPESKRIAESLLKSFAVQHQVHFNCLRIAHTYGPGMQIENDGRVMADFINDAVHARDIRLISAGTDERAFCYITDAIEAIFRVLLDGKTDEAYNLANEQEPIPIIELARLIQDVSGNHKTVTVAINEFLDKGYCNYQRVALDTAKLEGLGWQPKVALRTGLTKTIASFRE